MMAASASVMTETWTSASFRLQDSQHQSRVRMKQRVHVCLSLFDVARSHTRACADSDATRPEVDVHRAQRSVHERVA